MDANGWIVRQQLYKVSAERNVVANLPKHLLICQPVWRPQFWIEVADIPDRRRPGGEGVSCQNC